MTRKVTVVDYGMGNLYSVTRAFEHMGAEVLLTNNISEILAADRLILPGVGAFGEGMEGLRKLGLVEPLRRYAQLERPFMGICLGMQMMLATAEEFGQHEGLGLIDGAVKLISGTSTDGQTLKVPHIGWNRLERPSNISWDKTPLKGTELGTYCYFVHSYEAKPSNPAHVLSFVRYGGHPITAVIGKGSVFGCQFHPERSGPDGLKIVENFLSL